MELLQLRFGNPMGMASRIISELESLPKICEVGVKFVNFVSTVKNAVAALDYPLDYPIQVFVL